MEKPPTNTQKTIICKYIYIYIHPDVYKMSAQETQEMVKA